MLYVNQYYQHSFEFVQSPTKLRPPKSTTSAHEAASVLRGSSSDSYLTTAVDKSLSPFPRAAPRALQRCSKNLRDFKQFLSPPTSFKRITRALGQQTLVRKRAGDKQKTPRGWRSHAGCFSFHRLGRVYFYLLFFPHFCLLCKNASQRLLAEISHL